MIPSQRVQLADSLGNLNTTGNPVPIAGTVTIGNTPVPISISSPIPGSPNAFFIQGITATNATNNFGTLIAFGFTSINVTIKNDGSAPINFSFDGVTNHGTLLANEDLSMDNKAATQIAFEAASTGQTYRVFAW